MSFTFRTMVLSSLKNRVQSELARHIMESTYPALWLVSSVLPVYDLEINILM